MSTLAAIASRTGSERLRAGLARRDSGHLTIVVACLGLLPGLNSAAVGSLIALGAAPIPLGAIAIAGVT